MCLVIIKPAGVQRPTDTDLKTMCEHNHDGFGLAIWSKKSGLEVKKTMNMKEFMKWCKKVTDDQVVIFHARIATHGSIGKKNCHPFLSDDAEWAFAHNGVLGIANEKDMTDSETFFRRIAIPLIKAGSTPGTKNFDLAVDCIIGNSKFAFLSKDGELHYYGNYIHDRGLLFSNSSYVPYSGLTMFSMPKKLSEVDDDEIESVLEEFRYMLYYYWGGEDGMERQDIIDEVRSYYPGVSDDRLEELYDEAFDEICSGEIV